MVVEFLLLSLAISSGCSRIGCFPGTGRQDALWVWRGRACLCGKSCQCNYPRGKLRGVGLEYWYSRNELVQKYLNLSLGL